jgi:hypothetical protein
MTQILKKRSIRTTSPPHHHPGDGRTPGPEGREDAAELAAGLRRLATQSFHAVKEAGQRGREANRRLLADLRAESHRLQAELEGQGLDPLATYVAALRRQVEWKLGTIPEA